MGRCPIPFQGFQTQLQVAGIGNAATGQQAYAPGMIMSIYGAALGTFAQSAATIPLPQYLAGFEATINGVPAPLYYVSPNQVNVQIPYETSPGRATLVVGNPYANVTYHFQVSAAAPGIFTFQDGGINPFRSAAHGQTVTMFITGDGQVTPSLATGATPSPRTQVGNLPKPLAAGNGHGWRSARHRGLYWHTERVSRGDADQLHRASRRSHRCAVRGGHGGQRRQPGGESYGDAIA